MSRERAIVITGIGLVTCLGTDPPAILRRISRGENGFAQMRDFPGCACRQIALVNGFDAEALFGDSKVFRMMGRDAVFAVAAARSALADSGIVVGETYAADQVGLYGATGTAGLAMSEAAPLVGLSIDEQGSFDLRRFGEEALKRVRPVLSFKILSNMPICFVSIFENIQGANAVYSPWEGQGSCAIEAGMDAIRWGDADCALVGGCDSKANEFAMAALEREGVLDSWTRDGAGVVPGEGAAFLVLEYERRAAGRGARIYARIRGHHDVTGSGPDDMRRCLREAVAACAGGPIHAVVSAESGDGESRACERECLGGGKGQRPAPKKSLGDTFAAAAAVQVAIAALVGAEAPRDSRILANCLGHGSRKTVFVLESIGR